MSKKVVLSGIQPSGELHIGNYFGAIRQFVELQDKYQSFFFIANYHALTSVQDKKVLSENSLQVAIDYLSLGLDPKKTTIFLQSDIPEVAELAWIFNTVTTMPYLMRAHAFKDAEARSKDVNVGLFDYPVLMAADILIQDANLVPVGADQKQHVEITRDIAEKFNRIFGDTFKLPEPLILESVATVIGTDGRKMSKSYGNTIGIFASDEEIRSAVMSITTDSKGVDEPKNPEECNVFSLHKLFSENILPELKKRYLDGGIGYKESKDILVANMVKLIAPLREKRAEISANPEDVLKILKDGGDIARERAHAKMIEVREKTGLKI